MTPPKVSPPHYSFLGLVMILGLGYFGSQSLLPEMWHLLGLAPITLGLIIAGVAVRQFSKAETNIVPLTESTTLVTGGSFTISRNPMYVGMVAVLVGTAVLLNELWPWLVIVPFWLVIRLGFVCLPFSTSLLQIFLLRCPECTR